MNVAEAQIFLTQMIHDDAEGIIVRNAVRCHICGAAADRHSNGTFVCQKNHNHVADTYAGIFTDLTPPPLEPDRYT